MYERNQDTTTLNTLIATLRDSVEGYTKSADDIRDADLAGRFRDRARERESVIAELQATVARLGGNPEDDGSAMGGVHRAWLNLKEAVTGTDDEAIIEEVERGEDYLKEKFEAALKMDDLSAEARGAIARAWDSVKAGHDEMSRLKHRREGADDYARTQEYASESERSRAPGYVSESDRLRRDDDPLI